MKVLILKMGDGTTKQFERGESLDTLLAFIRNYNIETIVCGDVEGGEVHWEKQFQVVDVMPTEFERESK